MRNKNLVVYVVFTVILVVGLFPNMVQSPYPEMEGITDTAQDQTEEETSDSTKASGEESTEQEAREDGNAQAGGEQDEGIYEDRPSVIDKTLKARVCFKFTPDNPEGFFTARVNLLSELLRKLLAKINPDAKGVRYVYSSIINGVDSGSAFCEYLSKEDCRTCLGLVIGDVQKCNMVRGRTELKSCKIEYSLYTYIPSEEA